MIQNRQEYEITKKQADKIRKAISEFSTHKRKKLKIDDNIIKAELAALESMYGELLEQMQDYESKTSLQ